MADHYTFALGRRKSSTAKVRVTNGKGEITVNGVSAKDYFAGSAAFLHELEEPFRAIGDNKFNVTVVVDGGGHAGQVGAIKLGIAKALVLKNEALKGTLKKADLLGRDPREKERKKFGLKGARKQRQFTKR
ncbi:MAG TPA: 30S ribosomal protein S9 [Candidatus Saccharibacteria bacterium]|jgi:small subunit ribosomal protein S9|nr:30S ribosomal protein S9 [Candidatus Saccharibacteria bacterium]HMT55372.1 30S ribosomal protein S9 [Candidatus Saccharibacteria bacterium]